MINIAIDGPSGAGKSTIAKLIAKKYGLIYLDTGAMYRGVACYVLDKGVLPSDEDGVLSILDDIIMDIKYENGAQKVIICEKDVTPFIREHNISMAASTVSKIPAVRIKLVELQRKIAAKTACVLDGRDIGSYVLPNATVKFFLTADPAERAKRRHLELCDRGETISFDEVLKDILARDKQDSTRAFAPLKAMPESVIVDTTKMTIEEVLKEMSKIIDGVI